MRGAADLLDVGVAAVGVAEGLEQRVAARHALHADAGAVVTRVGDGVRERRCGGAQHLCG